MYKVLFMLTLVHGTEIWDVGVVEKQLLNVVVTVSEYICGVIWRDRIRNEEIRTTSISKRVGCMCVLGWIELVVKRSNAVKS